MSLSGVYRAANLQSLALHTHDDELLRGDSEELVVVERTQALEATIALASRQGHGALQLARLRENHDACGRLLESPRVAVSHIVAAPVCDEELAAKGDDCNSVWCTFLEADGLARRLESLEVEHVKLSHGEAREQYAKPQG